ncbi:MAG TPA: ATP-grasp domain-containing protein [Polyangiaceae bacterium]|nr:ATP-grasp domain-containing protein [Polyangiaceae bacterium]
MKKRPLSIGVTGMNATDNPAPGVGVIRSLAEGGGGERLVGLAYDALDPGVYAGDIVRDVFLLPYPSSSLEAYLDRLEYIQSRVGLDVIVPTLDAELPAFIAIEDRLRAMGIVTLLPTRAQFDLRSKANLAELGRRAEVNVPKTVVVNTAAELATVHEKIAYPFWVKGVFYGAVLVNTLDEAYAAFHKATATWGAPIIIQSGVSGEELNVVGVGDGEGGLIGAVPMKKLLITDKGKGWAGVTIRDPELLAVAERFVKATGWRGAFEVEVIRERSGQYQLLEINPRFPAWVHLATAAGMNLPRAAVEMARGAKPAPLRDYSVGTVFVRISIDQIAGLGDLERILTSGEVLRASPTLAPTFVESDDAPRSAA